MRQPTSQGIEIGNTTVRGCVSAIASITTNARLYSGDEYSDSGAVAPIDRNRNTVRLAAALVLFF
jgi:hypothetical protein